MGGSKKGLFRNTAADQTKGKLNRSLVVAGESAAARGRLGMTWLYVMI